MERFPPQLPLTFFSAVISIENESGNKSPHSKIVPCVILLAWITALSIATDLPAQTDELIWDRTILHQPFDKQPFRQVRVPGWVEETIGCGYTLSVMDTDARTEAVRHGVAISEMGFVNPFFACYDSKLIKMRSPDFPPGRLERDIAEYKRLKVRILAVYPPCFQGEVYGSHPEWRRIATNTREIPTVDMQKFPHGGMLCLLGPYGDRLGTPSLARFGVARFDPRCGLSQRLTGLAATFALH